MANLVIEEFCKSFGDVKAVDNLSLTVAEGEFLTLLGPSGCGKSTTLFAIAGLDVPTSGRMMLGNTIFYDSATRQHLAPELRNLGLVFQSYALWPHMTVKQNLEYPLRLRKVGEAKREEKIHDALSLVEMSHLASRYPHELSGGQQQRVALARTLVYEPRLLLLDEPLSNLDAKLRIKARGWLKSLTKRLGLTTIYVTHDQTEALSLSDRIAIMNNGELVQLDTPENIYRNPRSKFVADFIGNSNFLKGTVNQLGVDKPSVASIGGVPVSCLARPDVKPDEAVIVSVRPEHFTPLNGNGALKGEACGDHAGAFNVLSARILSKEYLGARYEYLLRTDDGQEFRMETDHVLDGEMQTVGFSTHDAIAFSAAGAD